jgi:hypothetical protein
MDQQPKIEKKPKSKSKAQIRDLKPKKDAKGGDGITFTYSKPSVEYKQQ